MRILPLTLAMLLLGGCNMVTSKTALFTAADADGAPRLRTGIWVHPDPKCVFDTSTPAFDWPGCAGAVVVRPLVLTGVRPPKAGAAADGRPRGASAYVIAGVYPSVMQIRMVEPHKPATYVFEGLRPLEFDAQGRVIAASAWLVQCGPPEPPPAGGSDHLYRPTKRPLPGLTMKGPDCVARDPETVLRATRASETWPQNSGEPAARIHWVRDGVN